MFEILKIVVPALLGILGGLLSAWFTMRSGYAIKQRERESEARDKLKLQYLDPLRVATQDLRDRLIEIRERQNRKDTLLTDTIQQLKSNKCGHLPSDASYNLWRNEVEFSAWANDIGCFALSTLRITALYFYRASKMLEELPYVELSVGQDVELRSYLINVKRSLGGPYGVWHELQDSLGEYLVDGDNKIKNYKDFCYEIFDDKSYYWFLRLITFFQDFHLKTDDEVNNMIQSLNTLDSFLKGRIPKIAQLNQNIKPRFSPNIRVHRTIR
jgi:hypothetical protein